MESVVSKTAELAIGHSRAKAAGARAPAPDRARVEDSRQALPPVILLGGEANALSVARDLGRGLGVAVHLMLEEPSTPIRWSRYAQAIHFQPNCAGTSKGK